MAKTIEPEIVEYLKSIESSFVYCTDTGATKPGTIAVVHLSYNRTYKFDGGDNIVDELLEIRIKMATADQVKEIYDIFIDALLKKFETTGLIIEEPKLVGKSPVLKEAEKAFYQDIRMTFLGNFKN